MTAGRAQTLLQTAGLKESVLDSLERGDSIFVLTDDTLLFQDSGGIRRVTLRDLRRIHSDESGLLRVETPAGTALTASLLGFDPVAVQSFFRHVKEATRIAKEKTGSTTGISEPLPAASQPSVPTAASEAAVAPPSATPASGNLPAVPASPAATWNRSATPPPPQASRTEPPVALNLPAAPQGNVPPVAGTLGSVSAGTTPRTVTAPTIGTPGTPPSRPITLPPPPAGAAAKVETARSEPIRTEAGKTVVRAVRTPTVITDPAMPASPVAAAMTNPAPVLDPVPVPERQHEPPVTREESSREESSSADSAPVRPVPTMAGGVLSSLTTLGGSVGAWAGRLKFLSVIMLLAALALAYLQFDRGEGLNGVWVLIAGGMSAVGLWALGDITRLLAALANAVGAQGGAVDAD